MGNTLWPNADDVFLRGSWWKRRFRKRFVVIIRGPVHFTDTVIFMDLSNFQRHEVVLPDWRVWASKVNLHHVGQLSSDRQKEE